MFVRAATMLALACRATAQHSEPCMDTPDWLCPGAWETCADDFASCFGPRCCQSAGFGCMRSVDHLTLALWQVLRPVAEVMATQVVGESPQPVWPFGL